MSRHIGKIWVIIDVKDENRVHRKSEFTYSRKTLRLIHLGLLLPEIIQAFSDQILDKRFTD
ncbi:hypothetical protein C8039_18480 [Halogeometricum sp. wsp3]|nr:hypothetical protein C8039_18480 [Halogeometricum sp. wsp3]